MKKIVVMFLIFGMCFHLYGDDFGRDVSMSSGFEDTGGDLKPEQNINFIKEAAKAKATHGKRSAGIYTKDGSQTVGSTILQNSKALNVYNYSEIEGSVVNINKK
jgi:hypothetical protein